MNQGKLVAVCAAATFAVALGYGMIVGGRAEEKARMGRVDMAAKLAAQEQKLAWEKTQATAKLNLEKLEALPRIGELIAAGKSGEAVALLEPYAELNDLVVSEAMSKARIGVRDESIVKAKSLLRADNPRAARSLITPLTGSQSTAEIVDLYARINDAISKLEDKEQTVVAARRIAERKKEGVNIGTTQEEVVMSQWGKPKSVNRTITANGVHEQWVYGGGYLYFENGKLTTIQN